MIVTHNGIKVTVHGMEAHFISIKDEIHTDHFYSKNYVGNVETDKEFFLWTSCLKAECVLEIVSRDQE